MWKRIKAEWSEIIAAIKDDTPRCVGCGRCGASMPSKDGKEAKPFVCIMMQQRKKKES